MVDRRGPAAAAKRFREERPAAAADLEQHVVGMKLQRREDRPEARPVVRRVAVALARGATGGTARPAIGEPVADPLREQRLHEWGEDGVRDPAGLVVLVDRLRRAQLE